MTFSTLVKFVFHVSTRSPHGNSKKNSVSLTIKILVSNSVQVNHGRPANSSEHCPAYLGRVVAQGAARIILPRRRRRLLERRLIPHPLCSVYYATTRKRTPTSYPLRTAGRAGKREVYCVLFSLSLSLLAVFEISGEPPPRT